MSCKLTAVVYRCLDGDDRLLYVGVSSSVKSRLRNHRYTSPWFGQVARVTTTPDMPWEVALETERSVIAAEGPLHNKARYAPLPPITVEAAS